MIKKCGDNVTLFCFILFCAKYKKYYLCKKCIYEKDRFNHIIDTD